MIMSNDKEAKVTNVKDEMLEGVYCDNDIITIDYYNDVRIILTKEQMEELIDYYTTNIKN